jgi:hypothetical protein
MDARQGRGTHIGISIQGSSDIKIIGIIYFMVQTHVSDTFKVSDTLIINEL